jgi:hypothetical protein
MDTNNIKIKIKSDQNNICCDCKCHKNNIKDNIKISNDCMTIDFPTEAEMKEMISRMCR